MQRRREGQDLGCDTNEIDRAAFTGISANSFEKISNSANWHLRVNPGQAAAAGIDSAAGQLGIISEEL